MVLFSGALTVAILLFSEIIPKTIGVVLNDFHNQFFAEVADGIQAAADRAGYRLLFGNGKHSIEGEAEAVETFLQFRVDGVILAGSLDVPSMERAARSAAGAARTS